jgi:hypothetical protein
MSLRSRLFVAAAALLLILATSWAPLQQTEDGLKFEETGQWVSGAFLVFYQQTPDPLSVLGLPISCVFIHPLRPEVQVQYFQKARLEFDPSSPLGQQVKLAPLGSWIYEGAGSGTNANIDTSNNSCRFFAATGHSVCFAFRQYYDSHAGETYFGLPVSEVEELPGGRLVQYFEYARMEWRPDRPVGMRVLLTDLGAIDFEQIPGPLACVEGVDTLNNPGKPLSLIVRAFPTRPILQANSWQQINIIVQDQLHQPVKGALVTVTIRRPDGTISNERPVETNADGFTHIDIPVGNFAPNQTFQIDVTCSLTGGPSATTSSGFRIWW